MKWLEMVRFELAHQLRRKSTWLLFGLFLFPLVGVTNERLITARNGEILYNAPLLIAESGIFMGVVALLIVALMAGDAATRDVQTRMEPMMHAAPVGRAAYLGGRFAGVLILAALLSSAVPLTHVLVPLLQPEAAEGVVGPLQTMAYLQSYLMLMLPNAFIGTALLFCFAAIVRHPMASWVGVAVLFLATQLTGVYVGGILGRWELAALIDPLGWIPVDLMGRTWAPPEFNQRLIGWDAGLLANRVLWITMACVLLFLTLRRFDFGGGAPAIRWWQRNRLRPAGLGGATALPVDGPADVHRTPGIVPVARRVHGPLGRLSQTLSVVRDSVREIAPRWTWLGAPFLVLMQAVITLEGLARAGGGAPVLPTTGLVVQTLGPVAGNAPPPVVLVAILLPIVLAGELVWRERDNRTAGLVHSAPVPDGVLWFGKLLGLWLVIAGLHLLLAMGGMLAQVWLGWYDLDPMLYARLLALRLVTPLLFSLFALSIHVIVNHKVVGHALVLALALGPLILAESFGIEHPMLVLGSTPDWHYSDISGFEPFLGAVLWFDLYWTAWALLLASVAWLFWVRGEERGTGGRLRLVRARCEGARAAAVGVSATLVLLIGGVVFYNTNGLNEYRSGDEQADAFAEYERRYGQFDDVPQPVLVATELAVEVYAGRGEGEIRGVHHLVNDSNLPIDTLHVATSLQVETRAVELDRSATAAVVDGTLGHHIYVLAEPLLPGDSLKLTWEVHHARHGFPTRSITTSIVGNGSFFVVADWIPLIGYQPGRELLGRAQRSERDLPERRVIPPLMDPDAPYDRHAMDYLDLAVTVGTTAGQIAVAPGELVQSWTEEGRSYFRYETTAPIGPGYAIFSADYEVSRERWGSVDIEVLHDPAHTANVPTMIRSMKASLKQLTERFGPFPYEVIRMVEYPAEGGSLHSASATIWYRELFSLFDPERDPRRIDMPFAVVAHEVAHQFQPVPARMEGRVLLSESFAWYAAMGVIEEEFGPEHLGRFLDFMRTSYLRPRSRADVALLRANDAFLGYRKGPFAMYALREYVGEERVDLAWRRLRERHASHEPPFATSLDLYRELQEVTPDSLRPLLGDLLERNTFWELSAEEATVAATEDGQWRVTLEIRARKIVVDTLGTETGMPMDDPVEVGVFAAGAAGVEGPTLYLRVHRLQTGPQTVTITVPRRPARAGIDPRHLLIDVRPGDNVVDILDSSSASK